MRSLVVVALILLLLGPPAASAVTLEDCIQKALAGNPNARAAAHRVEAAQAMLRQAKSGWYPRVGLSASYTRTDNPPQAFMMQLNQRTLNMGDPAFNPNQPDDTENIRLSAGMKYRLYDGGQRERGIGLARLGGAASDEQRKAVRNELVHQVTEAYYRVLQAQAFVTVSEESVKSLEESLRMANKRLDAGAAVKTDALNLEVKLAQAQEDLIRARNGVKLAVAALNTAIGQDLVPEAGLPVPARRTVGDKPPPADCAEVENRPELKAARKAAEMKRQAYLKARSEYGPVVNAFGSYDWDSERLDDMESSYLVGVMAEWEVFSGPQRPGAVRQARAEWQAALQNAEAARNNLRLDLRSACLQSTEAWERLSVTRKSIRSAEEALRITSERYRQGAADVSILLTAEVGLTATRTRDAAAYYDYLIALSNVERAQGRLVEKGTVDSGQ